MNKVDMQQKLDRLWKRGTDFLGCEYAILGGAMTWVSERHLVSAISNAGGFGILACGAMTPDLLSQEIAATKALTKKPFGVNLITMHPDIEKLIDVAASHQVGHIILAGGLPSARQIEAVKASGAKLICFAPALVIAKKLLKMGTDAFIIEGMEAGGHIGSVSTSVLAQEILPEIRDVPVFVAGGIGRGEAILSYLDQGAAGVQLGTRFVCASESIAHPQFKNAFIKSHARDAQTSVQLDPRLPVIPVRAIKNKASQAFLDRQREIVKQLDDGLLELKEAQLAVEHFWAGSLRRAVVEGDIENGSVMAGQSVVFVTEEQPVEIIINDLRAQIHSALMQRAA
jgi:enoyl-[acyl-carrier protein] reductase II